MPRRLRAVALLAALVTLTSAVPGLPGRAAAASCSGWTSSVNPPSSIRVFRHATGAVETVDFQDLRQERAVARVDRLVDDRVAARGRAGGQALRLVPGAALARRHQRGRRSASTSATTPSTRSTTRPSRPGPRAAAAVDATWSMRVLKDGKIFPTYYNAGSCRRGVRRQRQRLAHVPVGHAGLRPGRQDRQPDRAHLLLPRRDRLGWDRSSPVADASPPPPARRRRGRPPARPRTYRRPVLDLRRGPVRHAHAQAQAEPYAGADPDAGRHPGPTPDPTWRRRHPPSSCPAAASPGSWVLPRRHPRRRTTRSRS